MRWVVLGLLAFLASQQARAVPFSRGLTGLTSVAILIEKLPDDAKPCGITLAALDAAVRLPLAASRLRVASNNEAATDFADVYVVVNVQRQGVDCVANVSVALNRTVDLVTPKYRVLADTWSNGSLITGPSYSFGKRVSDEVEGYTKQLIAQWLKDNAQ
jgi:hypothetical protein